MISKIKSIFSDNNKSLGISTINKENWKKEYSNFLKSMGDETQTKIIETINEKISILKNIGDELLIEEMSKDANDRMRKLVMEDREIYIRLLKRRNKFFFF